MSAEENADKPIDPLPSLKDLEERTLLEESQGLCDPASLEIFTTWYMFGGTQAGITPVEAMQMPSWLRKDFAYILSILGTERKKRKKDAPPRRKK